MEQFNYDKAIISLSSWFGQKQCKDMDEEERRQIADYFKEQGFKEIEFS